MNDRLKALRIEISDETRDQHLGEIRANLARHRRHPRGRRRLVLAVAMLLVLQAGVVWAAEGALPGDLLYPVKVAYEAPRSLFDPDVRLRHRVEEAERTVDVAPDRVADAITRADRVIDQSPDSDPALQRRLDAVREAESDRTLAPVGEPPGDPDRTDTPTTSEVPVRDSPTTTAGVTDRPAKDATTTSSSPASTTDPQRQRDATTTTSPPADG